MTVDVQTIAIICAGIGVLASVVFAVLGALGVRSLWDIRDALRRERQ